ncbi:MAG: activator of (R)-2-hydroxyglutaryl-CoA dehydratase [Bacteroidetes bacterium]|nr:activator of (R)-2-hydroxyglutaryl-CoA dehydratase [Bacteroidota bacterium]MBU1423896.1 activator of (R)-2-hydroxyglutaryl-CoA dehydratase [Bacteroidota bacterium]MBU2636860.1 activator of (R)-2-hydroxyglutaryl-CoA dehydratase [Bacteroidota bacterium]
MDKTLINIEELQRAAGNISQEISGINVRHFKRIIEKPFLKTEKETTTILLGGFTTRHDYFVRAGIEGLGYKVQQLPTPNIEAFHTGREYCNNGQCNPTYFTVGNLINYLHQLEAQGFTKKYIINNYILVTAGACGPCRFGMYESEYRLALRISGFDGFRVITFQQAEGFSQVKDKSGLEMNEKFFFGIVIGIVLADILNDIAFKIRPYEVVKGAADELMAEATEEIFFSILKKQRLLNNSKRNSLYSLLADQVLSTVYTDVLKIIGSKLRQIKVDHLRQVPIVKVTGEFWAQTTEGDGNFKMFSYLEKEGAEVLVEPISTWLLYLLYDVNQYMTDRRGLPGVSANKLNYLKKKVLIKLGELLLTREYNRFRKQFNYLPQPLTNQYLLEKLAHPFYNTRAKGGEGHLEVAKSIYHTANNLCHMVLSLKPFGCLPSTQSDGVHSVVTSHYPDMIFLPIETSGEGEINAYSRVQMALTDARIKCRNEFENALEKTKLSVEAAKEFISENTQLQSPFYRIPKMKGVIGRSANLVYHIKRLMK